MSPLAELPEKVLVVVPAYNEEGSVGSVVSEIIREGFDVVVVDDGSQDRTRSCAMAAGAQVVTLPFNLGIGGALRCGFNFARERQYEVVVQVDADGQHDPAEVRRLVNRALETGSHLLVGSRFRTSDGYQSTAIRRVPMQLLARIASVVCKTQITDATSGLRVIREPLLEQFARAYPVQYLESFEVLIQAGRKGYAISETGVTMRERTSGKPSSSGAVSISLLIRVLLAILIGHNSKKFCFMESTS